MNTPKNPKICCTCKRWFSSKDEFGWGFCTQKNVDRIKTTSYNDKCKDWTDYNKIRKEELFSGIF